jgi:tripartite-type tricarboxylate transporter receptor subunit TctC
LIVPSSPGGSADATARVLADGMTKTIGQRVVVENRAGASGNIGSDVAARSAPDGYTWLLINNAQAANVSLYKNLTYDLLRDLTAVTQVDSSPHVVVVHPTLPVKSVKELVALARQKPGQLDYASAGLGTVTHLASEIFKSHAGVDMRHVPYKGGGESLTSVVSGETIVYFSPLPVALPHMRNGRIRALGVTSKTRMPQVPDIPTVAEQGYPKYEFNLWNGLLVPAKTPREIIVTIRSAAVAAMKAPDVSKRMFETASQPAGTTPEQFGAFLESEVNSIAALVKRLKLGGG